MDLCHNRAITEEFDKLTTQQKSNFTRQWNAGHKDPTQGVRGKGKKATVAAAAADLPSDEEEEIDPMLDEVQAEEMRKARQKQREMAAAQKVEKVEKFEFLKNQNEESLENGKGKKAAKGKTAAKGKAKGKK